MSEVEIDDSSAEVTEQLPVRLRLRATQWAVELVQGPEAHYLGMVEDHGGHSYYVRSGLEGTHSDRYFHGVKGREAAARTIAAQQLVPVED